MPDLFLISPATVDAISYPAPAILNIDLGAASSLVAGGFASYATPQQLANSAPLPHYSHARLRERRFVSGRSGTGITTTPAGCYAVRVIFTALILVPVTIDGIAYAAGSVVDLDGPTTRDLVGQDLATRSRDAIGQALGRGTPRIDHEQRLMVRFSAPVGSGPTAPVFTTLPAISPTTGIVGATFTATDGTVTNGSIVSRRWLLGGAVIGTGMTVVPGVAGALVLENTAVGVGGTTVTTSSAVTVGAAGLQTIGPLGMNAEFYQFLYYGEQCAFLDHDKAGSVWYDSTNGNGVTIGADGYPTAVTAGDGSAYRLVPFDNPANVAGTPVHYACVTSRTGWAITVNGATNYTRTTAGGKERVEFDINPASFEQGNCLRVKASNINANPWRDGVDTIQVFRTDQESLLSSGRHFNNDQVRTTSAGSFVRMMNHSGVNGPSGNITSLSQWTGANYCTWYGYPPDLSHSNPRMPVEVMCWLANEANVALWINIPHAFTNAAVRGLVTRIKANLNPNLACILEVGNEPWNFGGVFGVGWNYWNSLYSPSKSTLGNGSSGNYGYRAAQMIAEALDQDGYTGRFKPFFGTQNIADNYTQGVLVGIQAAMAEWATVGNANYNATYASKFDQAGKLFKGFGGATYIDDGIGALSSADQATVEGWADDPTDAGAANYFQQAHDGSKLTYVPNFTISNMSTKFAAQKAISAQYQIPMWAYEGGVCHDTFTSTKIYNFMKRLVLDSRMRTLVKDQITAMVAAGYDKFCQFTDVVGPNEDYGMQEHSYAFNSPKFLGFTDEVASPPVPAALTIIATTTGSYTPGSNPVTTLQVTGGRGERTVSVTGLAPGRAWNGWRTISGALTTTGTFVGVATVTDDTGTAAVNFAQVVFTPAAHRYWRFTPNSNVGNLATGGGYRLGVSEVVPKNSSGTAITYSGASATSASGYGGNVPGRICDGSTASSYITDPGSAVNGGEFFVDFGAGILPASFDIWNCVEAAEFSMGGGTIAYGDSLTGPWTVVANVAAESMTYTSRVSNVPVTYS